MWSRETVRGNRIEPAETDNLSNSQKCLITLHMVGWVIILLIPAFPSDHFDCSTPLLNFHLLHSLHVFKSWHSLTELLIVLLPGSTFVLAVPVNTSVCGSHWQLFCLWLSLAVLFSMILLLRLQRGFAWFTLPPPPPPFETENQFH